MCTACFRSMAPGLDEICGLPPKIIPTGFMSHDNCGLLQSPVRPVGHHTLITLANFNSLAALGIPSEPPSLVMCGRRPVRKDFFRVMRTLGCSHVYGLFSEHGSWR